MAVLKCKMCGGDVELAGDKTFGTCEYCGCTMTFPKVDDDQRAAAFNRGNHFRRIGEFDKALAVYERMMQEDDTDAEAHWCCALCRFGIEYVEDPATMEWLPTCHRASFDSFLEDVDYLAAVKHSAGITQRQYQKDAAKIADVQRGILATSQNTEPYDVFICYKETDEQGNRTKDSTLAQEIYYQLTEQGRRVFFSRITLEDVAGTQYEPYIFAALNSARVMIVVGTTAENLSAVWVKNEWSRFLSLMKKDHGKLLLPCYRDMDPYDLPEQLSVLQSYDMAKIGFIQDLTRGIAKVLDAEKKPTTTVVKETIVTGGGGNVAPLLKRAFMYLEDGEWEKADAFCEQVLNVDPECAEAYLGKLMAELQVHKREDLKNQKQSFDTQNLYQKVIRFGDEALKRELQDVTQFIVERNRETAYRYAVNAMNSARTEEDYKVAIDRFEKVKGYKDADALLAKCIQAADEKRTEAIYDKSVANMKDNTILSLQEAINGFRSIYAWKDSSQLLEKCEKQCKHLREQREIEKQEQQKQQKQQEKRRKMYKSILAAVVLAILLIVWLVIWVPSARYKYAVSQMNEGHYSVAKEKFEQLGDYKDSSELAGTCDYLYGVSLVERGDFVEAVAVFESIGKHNMSAIDKKHEAQYNYVASRGSADDETTYKYIMELVAAEYSGSEKLYRKLYGWKADIVVNHTRETNEEEPEKLSKDLPLYVHVALDGGPPNGETRLSYQVEYPSGEYEGLTHFDDEWSAGTGSYVYWKNGVGASGEYTIYFYDGDGKAIGERTFYVY